MQFQWNLEGKAGWAESKLKECLFDGIRKGEVLNSWRELYPRDAWRQDSVTLTSHHCTGCCSSTGRRHRRWIIACWHRRFQFVCVHDQLLFAMALSLKSRLSLRVANQAVAVPKRAMIRATTARSLATTTQCKEATNLEEFPDLRVMSSIDR